MKTEEINFIGHIPRIQIAAWLGVITILAFALRTYVSFFSGMANYNTDTYAYFSMADAIISGDPRSYFPNGYPLIVAATKILAGEPLLADALLSLNVILSTLVVLASYFIARTFMSPRLSLIACGIIALWPNQINYVRQLLTEVPTTFFLTLGILLLLRFKNILGGFILFLAGLIRSTISPLGVIISAYLAWVGQKRAAAFLLAGVAAGFTLNYALLRSGFIAESSNTGMNLLLSINKHSGDHSFFSTDSFTDAQKDHPLLTYLQFAIYNPVDFFNLRFASLWELWGPWPSSGDPDAPRSFIRRTIIGMRFPAFLLALVALWLNRNNPAVIIIGTPILLITLIHVAFFSTPRFTYTIEPFLIILAVGGATCIYKKIAQPKHLD